MGAKVQPRIACREIVKPYSATPNNHPTTHNLSFFDHISPSIYVPLVFFYKTTNGNKSNELKASLSAALSHYYPLAGRIDDNATIDCNDEGVLFLEATIESDLSEFLNNPDFEVMDLLFPDSNGSMDSFKSSLMGIQVTYFKCGGMSIGLCLSHKVQDMASMSSFNNDWASKARKSDKEITIVFNIGSLYPPIDLSIFKPNQQAPQETRSYVSRRVVFDGQKMDKLKAMVANQVPNPTRVEVATAVLYKSAMNAAAKASASGSLKPGIMSHVMNLRSHVSPQLSEKNKGNIYGIFPVLTRDDREVELGWLVNEFRKSKNQLSKSCVKTSNSNELCVSILNTLKHIFSFSSVENEVYICTSWCKFPFYEADFGWGKPLWVTTMFRKVKMNAINLRDTREGNGIEAIVGLEEKTMAEFEHDEEIRSFCCINPSIELLD